MQCAIQVIRDRVPASPTTQMKMNVCEVRISGEIVLWRRRRCYQWHGVNVLLVSTSSSSNVR